MEVIQDQQTQPVPASDFSSAELRSWLAPSAEKPDAPEPEEPAVEAVAEPPAEVPTEEKQQPEAGELPPNVQKRIAKEVERQAAIERKIAEAVSTTKAKEAELAKLTGKSGSEPAPTTAPGNAKPVKPDMNTYPGTLAEYNEDLAVYDAEYESWLIDETRKSTTAEVESRFEQQQRQQARAKFLEQGIEKHGAEFKERLASLETALPENLQVALSSMGDVAGLVSHLATNPADLKSLTDKFAANPFSAIAELGRLEERLQQAAKPPVNEKTPDKPLPTPLKPVGGNASASGSAVNLETAGMGTVRRELTRILKTG